MRSKSPNYRPLPHTLRPAIARLLALTLTLLFSACPRVPKLPQQSAIGGLLIYQYAGVSVMHQYSDRGYIHIRLHFGWQRPEENSYAAQALAVQGAFTCGAEDDEPATFAAKLENAGALMNIAIAQDGPVVLVDCLPNRLEAVWELFSHCLTDPMFDRTAYQDLRAGQIAAQKELETEPLPQALEAALSAAWPDQPMQGALKAADLEAVALTTAQATFRDLMRQRCNLHLTTIGPIDAEKITELLSITVEALPDGVCDDLEAISDAPALQTAKLVQAKSSSEALVGLFPGPSPQSIQSLPMRLVMHLLEKRLRDQLVQHDHVAQHVQTDYIGSDPGYNLIQISGTNAYQCAEFTLSELRKLKTYGFGETEVAHGLRAIQAEIALGYEFAPNLAARLDAAAADDLLPITGNEAQLLKSADPKSLSALLRQYLTGISWGIVGDTAGIDRKSLQRL